MNAPARILAIGGSDSSGGAGVQADIKTISALGGYALSAITAITAQDTRAVHAVQVLEPELVRAQIGAALADIGADAIKTGMLGNGFVAAAVADALKGCTAPVIVDPVLCSTSGTALLDDAGQAVLRQRLLPLAALVTPNMPEAALLAGLTVDDVDGQRAAAKAILDMGAKAVLVTGGHGAGEIMRDVLVWDRGEAVLEARRLPARHSHGTGCTLASAIATFMAQGCTLLDAVRQGRQYLRGALRHAPGLGAGNGPLGHGWMDAKD